MNMFILRCLFLLGCTPETPDTIQQSFISLHPSITETIYYLEGSEQLIGRSDYCLYPDEAKTLPAFGTAITPNIEKLAQQSSHTLLVDNSFSDSHNLGSMMSIEQLSWLTPADMVSSIDRLGTLLDKQAASAALNQSIQSVFVPPSDTAPKGLILMMGSDFSKGQLWYMKQNSIHGAMLEAAGYRNAIQRTDGPPQMSIEELHLLNPDFIILLGDQTQSDNSAAQLEALKALSTLQAVKNNRVNTLLLDNAYGTGPMILKHVATLSQTIEQLQQQ